MLLYKKKVGLRESTSAGGETALIKIDVYFESVQKGPRRKKRLPAALVISRELPKCLLQLRRNNPAFSCQVCTVHQQYNSHCYTFYIEKMSTLGQPR